MNKKYQRVLLVLVLVAVLMGGMTSCKKNSLDKETTLQLAAFPALDKAYEALIPEFNQLYPKIKVEIRSLGFAEHHNNLTTVMAAGEDVPDVAAIEISFLGKLGAGGGLENLLKKPYDAGKYEDKLVPFAWAQSHVAPDNVVGVPVDIAPATSIWRVDALEKSGIDYTKLETLEDILEAGKKFSRDTNGDGEQDQWMIPNAVNNIFEVVFRSRSEKFFDAQGNAILNRDDVKLGFEWSQKFRAAGEDGRFAEWSNEWYTVMKDGKIGWFPLGAWMVGHLKNWIAPQEVGKFRVSHLPALRKGEGPMYAYWGGSFLCIPKDSKNKEAAWAFIEFALQPSSQLKAFKEVEAFPSVVEVWNDPVFEEPQPYLGGQQAYKIWVEAAKNIPATMSNEFDSVANSIVLAACARVLDGEETVDEAAASAQDELIDRVKR